MRGIGSGVLPSSCPYRALTRLDIHSSATAAPVSMERFVARSADGERTVLLSKPLATVEARPFLAEAEFSRYLLGPWVLPVVDIAAPGGEAWVAHRYVPALPLPTVLALHGRPLPERTVKALAVALVETLAVLHGQNITHAGVSPSSVLIATDGPRLTCYGAARAAVPDDVPRREAPGLDSGSLPPEQAAGGKPRPLGDIYALGATLAYAATGYTVPEREELPSFLRPLVGRCLARDPAQRPSPLEMIEELVEGAAPLGSAQIGPATRAGALLGPGWLPARVVAGIAHQSASVLAAELAPAT
ncbi:serine/threonine protein kinase [Streptomyces sp. NPDC017260]|uniref:serine/threonine protein kinase n=1 Tax=unclassified Streptomyces TaxID=2593676 RepID=UPI003793B9F5